MLARGLGDNTCYKQLNYYELQNSYDLFSRERLDYIMEITYYILTQD